MNTELKTREVVDSTNCLNFTWVKWIPVFIRNIFCSPKCEVKFHTKSNTIKGKFLKKRWKKGDINRYTYMYFFHVLLETYMGKRIPDAILQSSAV